MFIQSFSKPCRRGPRRNSGAWLVLALLALAPPGHAESLDRQPLETLRQAARAFLEAQHSGARYPVEIEIAGLDDRLRLKPCQGTIEAGYAGRARRYGRTLLAVDCSRPTWQVYVPARVRGYVDALVASRALPRGSRLDAAAVHLEKRPVEDLRNGHFTRIEVVEDLETLRAVRPGTVLTEQHLAAPRLVRRGEAVMLVVRTGDFRIQMQGKAMDDGRRGGNVRVRNLSSGRVVEGRAVAPGVVEIAH